MSNSSHSNIINNVFETGNNPHKAVILNPDVDAVYSDGNEGPGSTNVNTRSTASSRFWQQVLTRHMILSITRSTFFSAHILFGKGKCR